MRSRRSCQRSQPRCSHGQTSANARARCSSTTCSCSHETRFATWTCVLRATRPMSGCSSTSSRTPTRSRSRSRCCWRRQIPTSCRRDWDDDPLCPRPGRLFFVGDPKQSIYRFRRADVELYRHAKRCSPTRRATLTENFRTVESIVRWVNGLFVGVMTEAAGSQPDYVKLTPHIPDHDPGPAVVTIGEELALPPTAEVRGTRSRRGREGDRPGEARGMDGARVATAFVPGATRRHRGARARRATTLPALDHGLDAAGIPTASRAACSSGTRPRCATSSRC